MAKAPTPPDPEETVAFSALIASLEDGGFDHDLSSAFRSLVARLNHKYQISGGKPSGKITVAIEFALVDRQIQTKPAFKIEPEEVRPIGLFYPTPQGGLRAHHPAEQPDLLKPTPKPRLKRTKDD